MRRPVDAARKAGHDDKPRVGKPRCKAARKADRSGRGVARADDGDGRLVQQRDMAPEGDDGGRVLKLRQQIGVGGQPQEKLLSARLSTAAISRSASALVAMRGRSEEHTSQLQSLMRISYAVLCLKKKTTLARRTKKNIIANNKSEK